MYLLEQDCLYPLVFYDNKVFREQMDILTYVQVCRITSIELILIESICGEAI